MVVLKELRALALERHFIGAEMRVSTVGIADGRASLRGSSLRRLKPLKNKAWSRSSRKGVFSALPWKTSRKRAVIYGMFFYLSFRPFLPCLLCFPYEMFDVDRTRVSFCFVRKRMMSDRLSLVWNSSDIVLKTIGGGD